MTGGKESMTVGNLLEAGAPCCSLGLLWTADGDDR